MLDTLMRTAIAQAGAARGLLILSHAAELRIAAQATTVAETVLVELPDAPVTLAVLPETVLHYVQRTRESVLLDDAATEAPFATDPYIARTRARSILCLPLLNQARLIGVLYLENNLAARAFAPARIAVLKVLASQAAISIENTRLYRDQHDLHLQLAHANRILSIGELSASIAHEINQPLSGIVVNASTGLRMLAADPPNINGVRETLNRAIRDANRASEVIRRLRSLYAKRETQSESVDLNEVIREVVALSRRDIERMRIEMRTALDNDLPPVTGDRVQLQQVILNLVRNASEAMINVEDRPRVLTISTAREHQEAVRVRVQDAGVGFERQGEANLFQAFYTTKSDGMGIGLSVSRSIIENHQGRIWAERNEGPGATFSFSIPLPWRAESPSTSNPG